MPDRSPQHAAGAPAARRDGDSGVEADWPAQAADTIVRVVGQVRDATTGKVETAARAIVYGLLAAILGAVIAVLAAIATVRALDAYLPGEVWGAHLITGAIFTIAGMLLWRQRHPNADDG